MEKQGKCDMETSFKKKMKKENELRLNKSVDNYKLANWKIAEVTNKGICRPCNEFYTSIY